MRYIIDRISEGKAVLESETGEMVVKPLSELPVGVREGSCLTECGGAYLPDHKREAIRRKKLSAVLNRLKRRGNKECDR